MNREEWVLAELKRFLVAAHKENKYRSFDPAEILAEIAGLEAETVLGPIEEAAEPAPEDTEVG